MSDLTRTCCRCHKTKAMELFIGKKANRITNTCRDCREEVDGGKHRDRQLRQALRELFTVGVSQ